MARQADSTQTGKGFMDSVRSLFAQPSPPKQIDFYITDRCNLRCKMCNVGIYNRTHGDKLSIGRYSGQNQSSDTVTADNLRKAVREIGSWKAGSQIFVSGGEPLLKKDKVFAILEEAKEYGLVVGMNSNATLLDKETADRLVRAGLTGITLSVDGPAEIHDDIRGLKGSFSKVKNAVEYLRQSKQEHNAVLPSVMVLLAIQPDNYLHLYDALDELSTWGLSAITFSHYAFTSKAQLELQKCSNHGLFKADSTVGGAYTMGEEALGKLDMHAFFEEIARVRVLASAKGVNYFVFNPDLKTEADLIKYYQNTTEPMLDYFNEACVWVQERIDIDSDGNIMFGYPCFRKVLGNLKEDSIRHVWDSRAWRRIKSGLGKAAGMPICLRCCGNRRRVSS